MPTENMHPSPSRRGFAAALIAFVITVAFACAVGYVFHSATNRGLASPEAIDCAQLARNIEEGRGFTTSFIRPLMLAKLSKRTDFPDVINAPLYPLGLAIWFSILGARDGAVAAMSLGMFALSTGLLSILTLRLTGRLLTAMLTGLAFVMSRPVLVIADSGRPLMLTVFLLLSVLILLTRPEGDSEAPRAQLRRFFVAGLLAALCYLTEYLSVLVVIPLAICWGIGCAQWNRRTSVAFVLGFVVACMPWWIRNSIVAGNPFYTMQWEEVYSQTATSPGLSHYRDMLIEMTSPLRFLAMNPQEMLAKTVRGLGAYYTEASIVPHLYLMPLVIASFFVLSGSSLIRFAKWGVFFSFVLFILGLSVLSRTSQLYLVTLAPLLTLLGVSTLQQMLDGVLSTQEVETGGRDTKPVIVRRPVDFLTLGKLQIPSVAARDFVLACFMIVISVPVCVQIIASPDSPGPQASEWKRNISKRLPSGGIVITDVPHAVAWYGQRDALWLPGKLANLKTIEKRLPVSAIYLSSALPMFRQEDALVDWQRVYETRPDIPGYLKDDNSQIGDVTYETIPSIKDATALAKANPNDPAGHVILGHVLKENGNLSKAQEEFAIAMRLRPGWQLPYIEAGTTSLAQNDTESAKRFLEKALQLNSRSVQARLQLAQILTQTDREQAIKAYELILADFPDNPIALNNLAFMYAEDDRDLIRAMQYARRAAAGAPRSSWPLDTLGWVCYRLGRYSEAVKYLQDAIELSNNNGLIQYHLGMALLRSGKKKDFSKAAGAFGLALTLDLSDTVRVEAKKGLREAVRRGGLSKKGTPSPFPMPPELVPNTAPLDDGLGTLKLPFDDQSENKQDSTSDQP